MNSGASELPGAVTGRQWGFVGSGKMATALIKGMLRAGIAPIDAIRASDPLPPHAHCSRPRPALKCTIQTSPSFSRAMWWCWPSSRRACARFWRTSGRL